MTVYNTSNRASATFGIGGGTTSYSTINDLPLVDNSTGDTAFVTANNKLYIWNGAGWYAIATVNETPTWDSGGQPESTYTVPNDGSGITITPAASDPEGFAITYTTVTDSEFDAFAEITENSDGSFTVTKLSSSTENATGTVTFRASDGVNILSNISTFTITFASAVENSNYTTALITGAAADDNQSITDSSTNNNTLTVGGNASAQNYSPYRSGGYSYYFDGNGDYLKVASSDATNMGTGDFTIECWFYRTATAGNSFHDIIISNREDASFASGEWSVYVLPTTNGQFGFQANGDSAQKLEGGTCITGQWHHIAVVRSSGTMSLYVDGTSVSSNSNTSQIGTTSKVLNLGAFGDGSYKCEGYVSDARLVSGTAVYTSNFTPPTERLEAVTNTSLLICHLPYFKDGSTNDYSITVNGDVSAKPFAPYDYSEYDTATHGGSIYFDGSGDYIDLGNGHVTTGDFTIEFWARSTTQVGDYWVDLNGTNRLSLFYDNGDQGSGPDQSFNAYDTNYRGSAGSLPKIAASWNHVAWVRSGGTITHYVNGVSKYSWSNSLDYTNANIRIGSDSRGFGIYVNGNMSDFRIVNGTAVYTSNFTPPTEPLTDITNTSILISGTDGGIIDKSQSSKLILNGGISGSTTQTKYGTSVYFDGSDDKIYLDPDVGNFGTGDFTIEMWLYPTESNNAIFRKTTSTGSASPPSISTYMVGTTPYVGVNSGSSDGSWITASSSFTSNAWNHFAITRESGTVTIWINGTSAGTATRTNNVDNTTEFRLGEWRSSNENFMGYIEDFRLTKGLARYTANFTPSSASLEG
jgi:hypothetical protein